MKKQPKAELKNQLSELDALKFKVATEKILRATAQLELARAEADNVRLDVSLRYGLSAGDNINLDTGAIIRKPAEASSI